jgi:hypothetical protein
MRREAHANYMLAIAAATISALSLSARLDAATVLRVDAALATGANNGSSWPDAFQGRLGLQAALGAASAVEGEVEIWVARGTYAPALPNSNQDISFVLTSGVGIYGGFQGGEVSIEERDFVAHPVILTADLNDNDATQGRWLDNVRHVVRAVNADATAVLDGVTVRDGYASGNNWQIDDTGAGMHVTSGSPVIRNCIFRENWAGKGGGIALLGASPTIEDCSFFDNTGHDLGAGLGSFDGSAPIIRRCRFEGNICGFGGGMYSGPWNIISGPPGGAPVISDCDFVGNLGQISGGSGVGMADVGGTPKISRCRFIENITVGGGGGLYLIDSAAILTSCDIVGNVAQGDGGGGVFVSGGFFPGTPAAEQSPHFVNCRFIGNNGALISGSETGCALTNCTIAHNSFGETFLVWPPLMVFNNSSLRFRNCVIWGNQPFAFDAEGLATVIFGMGDVTADFCCIQEWDGTRPGIGTMGSDPMYADAAGTDGELGTEDDDVRLTGPSPCIDAASLALLPHDVSDLDGDGDLLEPISHDFDGESRVSGCGLDMGAFEFAAPPPHSGDMDGNGVLDIGDISGFVAALLADGDDCFVDLNADGAADGLDLALFTTTLLSP